MGRVRRRGDVMSNKKVWFITGAGRGMGLDFAKAALTAGHAVVATGRYAERVAKAVGASDNVLAVKLDVTSRSDAEAAVQAAVARFGRIDVLVNNAASFYAGCRGTVRRRHRPKPVARDGASAVNTSARNSFESRGRRVLEGQSRRRNLRRS